MTEDVFAKIVTERLRVSDRGRVYTRMTEVKCSYKPSVSLCQVLLRSCGINILVVVSDIPAF